MTVDISSILKEVGGRVVIDGNVKLSDTDFLGETYRFPVDTSVKGSISNNGKSLILKAVCSGIMVTQCARCMKDVEVPFEFEIDENLLQSSGEDTADDDVILFEGTEIDIDEIAADDFLLNVEGKYLCSEDCKGLCEKCGADLNQGDCGCVSDDIDPRWAALIDIMEKDK